jgi:cellulose 1,4-beta-cellobiosidase
MTRFPRTLTLVMVGVIACTAHWPAFGAFGPSVPTEAPMLSASAGSGAVKLSWTPVSGAAGYRVFRSVNDQWDPEPLVTTRHTAFKNSKLENGIRYSFTVAAYSAAGNGPLSLAVTIMPLAAPADMKIVAGDQRARLAWTASAGATSYTVYRRHSQEGDFSEIATGVVSPPFVDMGLTNGRRYYYRVRALAGDAESDLSASVSAVVAPTSR